jgi:prephenate dehydrogenase
MKLAIICAGLIGHSAALACRRAQPDAVIVEIERGESLDAARDADLVLLATPVNVILDLIGREADLFRRVITLDTGSTKQAIVRAARAAGLDRFVGGHPMAGSAASGASAARADLFDDKPWFLVPNGAAAEAVIAARSLVEQLGARAIILDDDGVEHDRVMAAVSHLPQAVASVLMTIAAGAAGERLSWAGNGLRDTTRLASADAEVWHGVFASNADQLRPLLLEMASTLRRLADELEDADALRGLFSKARQWRTTLES